MKAIQLPMQHPHPLANDLFEAMRQGLLIEVNNNNIYATPLCRAVVYYGHSSTLQSQPLKKDQRTMVFDYNNTFRPALEHYALCKASPPTPCVVFSLGQPWGPGRHVAQNLISIIITHSLAKHDLNIVSPNALAHDLLMDIPETGKIEKATLGAEAHLSQFVTIN